MRGRGHGHPSPSQYHTDDDNTRDHAEEQGDDRRGDVHIVTTDAATKLSTSTMGIRVVGRGNEDSGVISLGSLGDVLLIGASSPMSPMSALLNERGKVTVETEMSQSEDGSTCTSEEEEGDDGEEEEGDEDEKDEEEDGEENEDGNDIEENDKEDDMGDDKGGGEEGNEDGDGEEEEARDLKCSNTVTSSPSRTTTTPSTTDATTSPLPDNTN